MPTTAYYVRETVTATVALGIYKRLSDETGKCFGYDSLEKERVDIVMKQIEITQEPVDIFKRVKANVTNEADVLHLADTAGFVRFAIGGHADINDLIKRRKQEGRSDWYV
jgi:hypothetical protein